MPEGDSFAIEGISIEGIVVEIESTNAIAVAYCWKTLGVVIDVTCGGSLLFGIKEVTKLVLVFGLNSHGRMPI